MESDMFVIKHEEDLPSVIELKTEHQDMKYEIKTEAEDEHIDVKYEIEPMSSVKNLSEVDCTVEGLGKWSDKKISQENAEEAEIKVVPCKMIKIGLEEKCRDKTNTSSRPKNNKSSMSTETEVKRLTCDSCNKGTYFYSRLGNETFSCNFCFKIFSKEEIMKREKLQCNVCDKSFPNNSSLKKHKAIHRKPFTCKFCKQTFSQKIILVNHICDNANEKPFTCDSCSRSFSQKSSFFKHICAHPNVKPYVCEFCSKSFIQKSNLEAHTRVHTNEKPYKSVYCDKLFSD